MCLRVAHRSSALHTHVPAGASIRTDAGSGSASTTRRNQTGNGSGRSCRMVECRRHPTALRVASDVTKCARTSTDVGEKPMRKIYDITWPMTADLAYWPGDVAVLAAVGWRCSRAETRSTWAA